MVTEQIPTFAILLKRYRRGARLTQEELAERAGLSVDAVSSLERGSRRAPRKDTIGLLASALRLAPEEQKVFARAARGTAAIPATGDTAVAMPQGGFLGAIPDGPLVGRDDELGLARQLLSEVGTGQGRVLMLTGEPGIGKTRLAQAIAQEAVAQNFYVATGRCYTVHQAVPYFPFREALRLAYEFAPESLRAAVPQQWPELLRLLPVMLTPVPVVPEHHGPEAQYRLFWSITRFFQFLAAIQPVVILLDDLHWADEASLALFHHLASQTRATHLLLVGTYRNVEVQRQHPLGETLRVMEREHLMVRRMLPPLTRQEITQLVATVNCAHEMTADDIQRLYERTLGHPLYTQAILQAWEKRDVDSDAADGAHPLPESVRSAIGERVSHLAAATQTLIQEASVLGATFDFIDLRQMTGRSDDEIEACLDEAIRAGLIQETGGENFAFQHTLIQQTLYGELSTRRRRKLHQAAGLAIEQRHTNEQRSIAALIWHFTEGDTPLRALSYLLQAGRQAECVYAYADAEQQYRVAVDLTSEAEDLLLEMDARERWAASLVSLGRLHEALAQFEHALNIAREFGDTAAYLRILAQMGHAYARHGDAQTGHGRLQELLPDALSYRASHPRELAQVFIARARLTTVLGGKSVAEAELASQLALQAGDRLLHAQAEVRRGTGMMYSSDLPQALQIIEEALPLLEAEGDWHTLSLALGNIGGYYSEQGQLDRYRQCIERRVSYTQRLGDPYELANIAYDRAQYLNRIGDWQPALQEFETALAQMREMTSHRYLISCLLDLGLLLRYLGREEETRPLLDEATALAIQHHLDQEMRHIGYYEIVDAVLHHDLARAEVLIAPILLNANLHEDEQVIIESLQALLVRTQGKHEEADVLIERVYKRFPSWGALFSRVLLLKVLIYAEAQQQSASAIGEAAVREAQQILLMLPWRHEAAQLHFVLGRWYACYGQHEAARDHLSQGQAICREMDEHYFARFIDAALDAIG